MLATRRKRSLFDDLFDFPYSGSSLSLPYDKVRVSEDDGSLVYTVEIPGVSKDKVKVSVVPEDRMLFVETPTTKLKRTVYSDFSLEDIYASVENGLLEIRIPRRKKNTVEIEIH